MNNSSENSLNTRNPGYTGARVDKPALSPGHILAGIVVLAGLFAVSRHNFLLFHGLVELFSIAVAWSVFLLVWNTRRMMRNDALLFLGIVYLFVGLIDLTHTLTYRGMGVFAGSRSANPATQLWIAARGMEALSLMLFPLLIGRRVRLQPLIFACSAVTALIMAAIYVWPIFPDCFVEGRGLTPFKKASEYVIVCTLVFAAVLLFGKRDQLDGPVFHLMIGAISATVAAELAFTFYVSVYGLSNIVGHLLKIASFFLVFLALVRSSVINPYETVFRELEADRKRLAESEDLLRGIFNTAMDAIWVFDATGRIVAANPAAETLFGYTAKERIGLSWKDVVHADSLVPVENGQRQSGENGDFRSEAVAVRKGGETFPVDVSVSRLEYKGETHSMAVMRDITERKQAQKAIYESTERFQKVFNSQLDGIFVLNSEIPARVVECNAAAAAIFGYGVAELVGETISHLHVDASHLKRFQDSLQPAIARDGYLQDFEFAMKRRNGTVFPTEHTVLELKSDAGQRTGWISIVRDLTERKKMAEQIKQTQRLEAIGTLAGGIAHDFNNILFPIIGLSELLVEDLPPDSPEQENAQEILSAGKRGSDLVKQILAFSRQSEHKLMPVRVQQVVKEALKLARSTIPSNIAITRHIQSECGLVVADATQVHQVVMNLLTNAYHAVEPTGGSIAVQLKEEVLHEGGPDGHTLDPGRYAVLTVSDTGCGIAPEDVAKIFEPYFTTKAQGKGTGLGLSVVYGIVKEHGGDIRVRSEKGKGAAFRVYFPVMERSALPADASEVPPLAGGSERILAVDDEKPVISLECQMLERLGYRVKTMLSSVDALEAFKGAPNDFDLVITDMTMPDLTGDQMAREMIAVRPDIPVIICTGFSERLDREKAAHMGIRGFLMKPLVKAELARLIRKLLDEASATA